MISQATLKQDVRALTAKGVAQLSDADLRLLGWKTAAISGPVAVKSGSILGAHLAEVKVTAWRDQLVEKLERREKLGKAIEGLGGLLPDDVQGQLTDLEADCDRLASMILDAEDAV